jgi:hypothetical protein
VWYLMKSDQHLTVRMTAESLPTLGFCIITMHHHKALSVREFLTSKNTAVVPQPPYSPDVLRWLPFFPKDYQPSMSTSLCYKWQYPVSHTQCTEGPHRRIIQQCFQGWKDHLQQCVASEGDHIEM